MKKIFLLLIGLLFLGSVHGSDDDQGPSREDVLRNFLTGKRGYDTIVVESNDVALAAPLMRDLNGVGDAKKNRPCWHDCCRSIITIDSTIWDSGL